MTGTEDLPITIPLTFDPNYPSDQTMVAGTGTSWASYAVYFATLISNALVIGATAFIRAEIVQEQMLRLITALVPHRQYAAQYNAHGFYDQFDAFAFSRGITDLNYIKGNIQSFSGFKVNNLFRDNYLALKLDVGIASPTIEDNSRFLGEPGETSYSSTISSLYGSIKVDFKSQYGQLESIRQVPVSACVYETNTGLEDNITLKGLRFSTGTLFGGDTYINRYTEKNPFLFFNDWLLGQPADFQYDYRNYINVPKPKYWVDNRKIYASFFQSLKKYRSLYNEQNSGTGFYIDQGWFYLFCNGVRDFFVESDINVGYRDWEDDISKRFYDPYGFTDTSSMFRSDVIKSPGFYKYDYSLSVSRFYNQFISWGSVMPRTYDFTKAETCYAYNERRVVYSLPQNEELKRDNWRSFLVNNYKDFPDKVSSVRAVGKNGAMFFLTEEAPMMFTGTDSLQTDAGTKITLGDGGLFTQSLQSLSASDKAYRHASSAHRYAVVATPQGVFWVSQKSGKIFGYSGGIEELAAQGMKGWFAHYLPSRLLEAFPQYEFDDNPVYGIGVQLAYDNANEMLYVCKKDYRPIQDCIIYVENEGFYTSTLPNCQMCPTGYEFIQGKCRKPDIIEATSPPTKNLYAVAHPTWGDKGAAVYDPGYTVNGIGTFTHIPINGSQGTVGYYWRNKVNDIAKWTQGQNVNQWLGFKFCFEVTTPGTYHIGVAGDNLLNLKLDGQNILLLNDISSITAYRAQFTGSPLNLSFESLPLPADGVTYQIFHIIPVTISTTGTHTIEILVMDTGHPGMIAGEVYQNSKAQILAADSDQDLNIIFSTKNQGTFTSGEYTCPENYVMYGSSNSCTQPECRGFKNIEASIRPIDLCDPTYFEDVSWTASYDLKTKRWISFHDWHPSLIIPGERHFITAFNPCLQKKTSLWKHNERTDLFCNFYGEDTPFEVESPITSGAQVTTLRSIEFLLDSYRYKSNGIDRFHVLDHTFDKAMIYNSEQSSGMLRLNIKEKNNPRALLDYPKINATDISIHISKEEQAFRFNQFWDVTKDRGEFTQKELQLFNSAENGYTWEINPLYVDYNKEPLQRKKIRNNWGRIWLRKTIVGATEMLIKAITSKIQISKR